MQIVYNSTIMRKKRNDRNYILYRVWVGDETYVGLTVAQGRAFWKSIKIRVNKHISRALRESKDWTMCNAIREAYDSGTEISYEMLDVVRGRKNAYALERNLIKTLKPTLNDF